MRELRVIEAGLVAFSEASQWQQDLHRLRVANEIPDVLLLLEHPHVYTLGRRFDRNHLLLSDDVLKERGIEVAEADRGGSITYHGPGQLVGYPIIDLRREAGTGHPSVGDQPDVLRYLRTLEEAIIRALRGLGVVAIRRAGLTGVWVASSKIASIGVNITRGVAKHGFAINVHPDLSYFDGMVACGIPDAGQTSLDQLLKRRLDLSDVASAVTGHLAKLLYRRPVPGLLEELWKADSGSSDVLQFRKAE